MKRLVRQGVMVQEQDEWYLADGLAEDTDANALRLLQQGFSLHAAVRCHANERLKLERLCRYITRPALANDRVKINAKGQVELKLKTPWRDGATHHVLSPLEDTEPLEA